MTRKRRKFITDSDNSDDDEQPGKSTNNKNSSDSLSESSEEEEWTFDTETHKKPPPKKTKKDEKKAQNSAGSMESSPDEGELTESENESLSEDSDDATFDDGLDENCVGDAEDRNKLMSMTEAERERVLFERMEKRESMKTRQEIQRKLKLQKKKEEAAKIEVDRKKQEQETKAISRAQRVRKTQSDDKGKGKAIDELRAKREAHKAKLKTNTDGKRSPEPKALLKTKDVYTDDEDDDDKSLSSSPSPDSDDESDRAPSPQIVRNISTKEQLSKLRLSRFKLEKWVHLPFFKSLVCGCFIRIGIGDKLGKKIYRVAEIYDVVETPKIYTLGNIKTNKGLKVRHGIAENMYRLEFVSNQDFTDSEFMKWKTTIEQNNLKFPTVKYVDTKAKAIKDAIDHEYTNEEIDQIVKEKEKFRKNPRNFAAKKSNILAQKGLAEAVGDFAEVEKLKADLEDLETDADRLSKVRNKSLTAISYINDKNRIRTSVRIEEVLRDEYAAEKDRAPNPFQRRKTVSSVVTPNYQMDDEKTKTAELLKKLAEEREKQKRKEAAESEDTTKQIRMKESTVVDPFELHNDCDIDIDIGPIDSTPAISPLPTSSSAPKRGLNLSDYKKRTGLM